MPTPRLPRCYDPCRLALVGRRGRDGSHSRLWRACASCALGPAQTVAGGKIVGGVAAGGKAGGAGGRPAGGACGGAPGGGRAGEGGERCKIAQMAAEDKEKASSAAAKRAEARAKEAEGVLEKRTAAAEMDKSKAQKEIEQLKMKLDVASRFKHAGKANKDAELGAPTPTRQPPTTPKQPASAARPAPSPAAAAAPASPLSPASAAPVAAFVEISDPVVEEEKAPIEEAEKPTTAWPGEVAPPAFECEGEYGAHPLAAQAVHGAHQQRVE